MECNSNRGERTPSEGRHDTIHFSTTFYPTQHLDFTHKPVRIFRNHASFQNDPMHARSPCMNKNLIPNTILKKMWNQDFLLARSMNYKRALKTSLSLEWFINYYTMCVYNMVCHTHAHHLLAMHNCHWAFIEICHLAICTMFLYSNDRHGVRAYLQKLKKFLEQEPRVAPNLKHYSIIIIGVI